MAVVWTPYGQKIETVKGGSVPTFLVLGRCCTTSLPWTLLDAHENGPRVCSFFGPTNLVRSGESPLGILALDTLQRGRRLAERGRVIVPCKDWPSATAYGGCGLDKGLSPGPRLPTKRSTAGTVGARQQWVR